MSADCSFFLSVENGRLEAQAILLVESLRNFGGRHADSPIYAISPRPSRQMSRSCQEILNSLGVHIIFEDLLPTDEQYGTAARLAACGWAEKNLDTEIIVSLDNDLIFTSEPDFKLEHTDFFARPVDVKGMCTMGPGDPFDPYWRKISEVCEVDYDRIAWLETTMDGVRVKASYNGGMIAVRRKIGLFQKAETLYRKIKKLDLAPHPRSSPEVFASTGFVGAEASRWWGTSQAVLSLSATQLEARITIAPDTYNIPVHVIELGKRYNWHVTLHDAILIHYHWLFDEEHYGDDLIFYGADTLPAEISEWLKQKLPLCESLNIRP